MSSPAVALSGVVQRSPEWVAERRLHLGSSDAPVLAGERGSFYGLWAEKARGLAPAFDDATAELMEVGALLEPSLRALYASRTGRPIRARHVTLVRRDWPVAAASLDAESGSRVVELKWSHSAEWFASVARGSAEPVPGRVMAQVQWQLYVTGREVADVAVLLGRDFRVIEVGRDDRMIGDLEYLGRWLWAYVEAGEPPPVDGSEATTAAIVGLHPRDNGDQLPATPELTELVRSWRAAVVAAKAAGDEAGTQANAIRTLLGDRAGIDGLVSWRNNAPAEVTDWPLVAAAIADDLAAELEADAAPMLARYVRAGTKLTPGPRVLRVLKGGKAL